MKIKDLRLRLERKKAIFSDLQHLERAVSNDPELRELLDKKCNTRNIGQAITEARMSFYDKEILKLEKLIDETEVNLDIDYDEL